MEENNTQQTLELKPPYVGAPTLARVFEMLSTRSLPSLTASDLMKRGYAESVAFQIIQSLKFLGIVGMDNKTTEKSKVLYIKGEDRKSKLSDLVKAAYSKLFDIANEANLLPKDELHNEFLAVYGLSPRLASSAVPTFLWLCSEAGMSVKEEPVLITRKSQKTNKAMSVSKTIKYNIESTPSSPANITPNSNSYPLKSGVIVVIPEALAVKWTLDGTLAAKLKQFEIPENIQSIDVEEKAGLAEG